MTSLSTSTVPNSQFTRPATRRCSPFQCRYLRSVAIGKGLSNTSKMDRQIWGEFGSDRQRSNQLADLIRNAVKQQDAASILPLEEVLEEFFEGRVLTDLHKRRERHPGVRRAF
jgi:5-methylcytosine-specific restriction protein A